MAALDPPRRDRLLRRPRAHGDVAGPVYAPSASPSGDARTTV